MSPWGHETQDDSADWRARPSRREHDLVSEQVGSELLIFDTRADLAHCLGETAAAVWQACDGRRDAAALAVHTGLSLDSVTRALGEIDGLGLLAGAAQTETVDGVSRRHAIKRMAGVGAAATSLPLIVSAVIAPAAALAYVALGAACTPGATGAAGCAPSQICAPVGAGNFCIPDTCVPSACTTAGNVCSGGTFAGTCDPTTVSAGSICCM
jgi:hypothetical protein